MSHITIFNSDNAPRSIGPYSHAKIFNNLIFISGQLPIDPQTMSVVSGGIQNETHQVMKNLEAILIDSGTSLDNVLKCTIYLLDMLDFEKVNQVYGKYFKNSYPTRVTIAVNQLPKGYKNSQVEIEAIAMIPQKKKSENSQLIIQKNQDMNIIKKEIQSEIKNQVNIPLKRIRIPSQKAKLSEQIAQKPRKRTKKN